MSEYPVVSIGVAFMKFDGRLALAWNERWGAFVLPMTKLDAGPPAETAEEAAVRAAAEVFRLPVRVVAGQAGQAVRHTWRGGADGQLKDYQFTVVPVEVHPDFAAAAAGSDRAVLADVDTLLRGDYRPVSPSVKPILTACVEWAWLP